MEIRYALPFLLLAPAALAAPLPKPQAAILAGALAQTVNPASYVPGYRTIRYPGGDLPPEEGVCTDVVIRALRAGGLDLQLLIHEDMAKAFARYPARWGLKRPDPNIDHRRVRNQMCFLDRRHAGLGHTLTPGTFLPGDLVYWDLGAGLDHCGVVTGTAGASGWPLVVHNLGRTAAEDCLTSWPLIGHYRFPWYVPGP